MCRLFGMSGGPTPIRATFWLLDAPDSLVDQSRENPDGTGIGYFDREGRPHVQKQPMAAYDDRRFASEAREIRSRTVVSHIRHATNGGLTRANTHPFSSEDRIFAHNGVIKDVPALEAHLGQDMARVHGETDSERLFALMTREIEHCGGDVGAGIAAAVEWVATHLEVLSINFVLITDGDLWSLRYPGFHSLYVLERPAAGPTPALDGRSSHGTRVHSEDAGDHPVVVVASERLDEDPGWRELDSGELIHVGPALEVTSTTLDLPG